MEITTSDATIDPNADVIVTSLGDDLALGANAARLNEATSGAIQRLIDSGDVKGSRGEKTVILAPAGLKASHLVVLGLGASSTSGEAAFRIGASGTFAVSKRQRKKVQFLLDAKWAAHQWELSVAGCLVGSVGQDLFREQAKRVPPESIVWSGVEKDVVQHGEILGTSINLTRQLVNTYADAMDPVAFAAVAAEVAKETGISIEVWDEKKLAAEKCGALLAVARGSARPPRLVIMKYNGKTSSDVDLAIVGKGVTFDSGGMSIKSAEGLKTMKCDMAGAAAVLGAMKAVAQQGLKVNVVGVMGLVENMVSADCFRVGDVLTARNGRTIEVLNTDAEGRLVLADALTVAAEHKPAKMMDLATLTGSCVVALGRDVCGLMTNDEKWCDEVKSAAATVGEPVWELPMFSMYGEHIKSDIADIKNVGDGRWGGAITAAKLLEHFVDDIPWVHVDIAGPSFYDSSKPWMDAGASGVMVRTCVELAKQR